MRRFALSAALCLCTALPAMAQDYNAETVLATVNGKTVTLGHLIALVDRLPQQYQELDHGTLYNGMLEQLIDQALLADTVEPDPAKDTLRTRLTLQIERRAYLAGTVLEKLGSEDITEDDLQAAYDAKYSGYVPTKEYDASHILVASEDEAKDLIAALEAGADFAELAMEKSTGPSGPTGGALGWFGAGAMVPEFEAAVVALESGAISAPVQTQFGWHVVKLNDTRESVPPTLEQERAALTASISETRLREGLVKLREAADVTRADVNVPASAIREADLLDAN